ncbi:MAG: sigma-70 family RNA polymerase sigma factor [Planctomycetes bacterium]|nr:sigma-70 family RNA polymerase sigma factor [Planctomycetota bacterium]
MRKANEPKETVIRDQDLVVRAKAGEQEAYGELVERYQRSLEGILVPLASDPDHARDLAQETVLKAWKSLNLYDGKHRFSTWFFRIGVNLAISVRRRAQLEARLKESADPRSPAARLTPPESPVEAVLLKEDTERLREAIAALPDRYKKILSYRYVEELSCKEIAERLGTTPNTVSIVLFRAKQRLKEDLEES